MGNSLNDGFTIVKKAEDKEFKVEKANFEGIDTLKLLQETVGGYIEAIMLDDDMVIWVNEEGKINGMKPNTAILDEHDRVADVIFGDYIVTGTYDGDTIPLTREQANKFVKMTFIPVILHSEDDVVAVTTIKPSRLWR